MLKLSTEIRREQIKSAVLEIIYLFGISKFTTKRLASRIGISEAAIFRHYASKKEIFMDILQDISSQLLSVMLEIEQEKTEANNRLHKIVCFTINYFVKNKGVSVLMLSEIAENNDPEIREAVYAIFSGQRQVVERIAREGVDKRELTRDTDPWSLSMLYMGIPVGIQIESLLSKADSFEDEFCQRMSLTFVQNFLRPTLEPPANIPVYAKP